MGEKVTFNPNNLRVEVHTGVEDIDVQIDLYSDWKEDIKDSSVLAGVPPTFIDTFGGNELAGGKVKTPTFPFNNTAGWRIDASDASPNLVISGDLVAADPSLPLLVQPIVILQRAIDAITPPPTVITASGVASAVWDELQAAHTLLGSMGEALARLDVLVSSRASQSDILSDGTPFLGANIDAAVSSRSIPGDAMSLTTAERQAVSDQVWDEDLSEHTVSGSSGLALGNVSSGASASDIADAVLGEVLSDHSNISGSLAEAISIVKGLSQENYVLDSTSYNSSGLMTSGRLRIFSTASQVNNATDGGNSEGEIASFSVSVEAEPGNLGRVKIYKVSKS